MLTTHYAELRFNGNALPLTLRDSPNKYYFEKCNAPGQWSIMLGDFYGTSVATIKIAQYYASIAPDS